jgi:L-ribulose-5-phosphate 4-epimerase
VAAAVENAAVLEFLAALASRTLSLSPKAGEMPKTLLKKHFFRKHGPGAYYGQAESGPGPKQLSNQSTRGLDNP